MLFKNKDRIVIHVSAFLALIGGIINFILYLSLGFDTAYLINFLILLSLGIYSLIKIKSAALLIIEIYYLFTLFGAISNKNLIQIPFLIFLIIVNLFGVIQSYRLSK